MNAVSARGSLLFAAVLFTLSVASCWAAETFIGINFQGSRGGSYQGYPVTADADGIAVANWTSMADVTNGSSGVTLPGGGSLTVSWQCANTWTKETTAPAAGLNEVLYGYLDDGGAGYSVTISGLTNAGIYELSLLASSDDAMGFTDATVTWAGGSQNLVFGNTGSGGPLTSSSTWSTRLTADSVTITGIGGGSPIRGTLAAIEIGYDPIDNNSNIVVDAVNTNWQDADITLGFFGTNNLLHILNGGTVSNVASLSFAENEPSHDNLAIIEGTGSVLHVYRVYVGQLGSSNRMIIRNGGGLTRLGSYGHLGGGPDSCGNEVTVDGPGSLWQMMTLDVGNKGRNNTVTVTNGGTVFCLAECYIGANSTADGNALVVTGPGSSFGCDPIYFGQASSYNRLRVSDGATMNSAGSLRFGAGDAVGNELVVEGTGSLLHAVGDMNAMYNLARHNRMIIRDGGRLDNATGYFGLDAGAVSNEALITGAGSVWSNHDALFAGVFAEYTSVTISNGGVVYCADGIVGSGSGAHNALTVIGSGSLWQCSNPIAVGNGGSSNSLFVRDGGTVTSIGAFLGNVGDSALVTDPGSTWIVNGFLFVGGNESGAYGPGNTVTISNGGVVSATGGAVGLAGGNGILVGRNGLLIITNETGDAHLTLRGALRFDGGTAIVDRIVVSPNPGSGFIASAWLGGVGMIVGTVLVESNNALYVESGSRIAIAGAVTNRSVIRGGETGSLDFEGPVVNEGYIEDIYGTMHFHAGLQNQGAGILLDSNSARIASMTVAGSDTLIRFVGASNMPYSVSVASNLVAGEWTEEVTGITGSGAMMTVTNVGAATAPKQFRKINLGMPDYVP